MKRSTAQHPAEWDMYVLLCGHIPAAAMYITIVIGMAISVDRARETAVRIAHGGVMRGIRITLYARLRARACAHVSSGEALLVSFMRVRMADACDACALDGPGLLYTRIYGHRFRQCQ